jgi:hypothetical protein
MAWEIFVLAEYSVLSMSNHTIDLGSFTRVRVHDEMRKETRPSSDISGDIASEGMKMKIMV